MHRGVCLGGGMGLILHRIHPMYPKFSGELMDAVDGSDVQVSVRWSEV